MLGKVSKGTFRCDGSFSARLCGVTAVPNRCVLIVFAVAAVPLFASTGRAQPIRLSEATEIAREREPRRPLEPHLAVHPGNPNHLLATAMIGSFDGTQQEQNAGQRCATFLSLDGGATWARHDFPVSNCFDSGVALTADGEAVFTALGSNPPHPLNNWLVVYHSADGGRLWDPVPVFLGTYHDHPTVTADISSDRRRNWIYITSHHPIRGDDGKARKSVFVARSRNGGKTFDEPVRIVPNNLSNLTEMSAVLTDGTLLVSFVDVSHAVSGGQGGAFPLRRAWVMRSTDGGFTFSMPLFVNDACGVPPSFQLSALTADLSAGPFRDRLYFACRQSGAGPIVVNSSADGGETWTNPIAVALPTTQSEHRIPAIAVDARGVLAVAWLDRHARTGELCQELHLTASLDGGQTFLPEQRISRAACADSATNNNAYDRFPTNGDYFGLVSTGAGRFRIVWPETRNDTTMLLTVLVDIAGSVVPTKQ